MNTLTPKLKKIEVDKDRFDAILGKMAATKPLPVQDLKGTFPKMTSLRQKKESADSPMNDLTLKVAANQFVTGNHADIARRAVRMNG